MRNVRFENAPYPVVFCLFFDIETLIIYDNYINKKKFIKEFFVGSDDGTVPIIVMVIVEVSFGSVDITIISLPNLNCH
ncbi:11350_t:CDS:1, partial [Racocetra persica]